ncbi:hypothetical protein Tco_0840742 [Tanacetum coccineum]|uniref:Uncharacterized protein n=1 Tax=Tanacetum coccineum TaxID=301880 RepID=A0ABQ5AUH4_9ASTR
MARTLVKGVVFGSISIEKMKGKYLRGGSNDKKYTASTTKTKAAKYEVDGIEDMVPKLWSPIKVAYDRNDVYSTMRILSVTSVTIDEWYGYGHLKEIIVRRVDKKLYTFMEGDFPRLYLNDIKDMLLLVAQNKLNNLDENRQSTYKLKRKRLMRTNELYKFSGSTLTLVRDTLHQMLINLELGYNKAMRKRLWTETDQKRTRIMIKDINQVLLKRRIMRSLEKLLVEGIIG